MPLLEKAKKVTVLTVEGGTVPGPSGAELARQLPQWSEDRIAERVRWLPTCSDEAIAASLQAFNSLDPVPPLVCCSNPKVLIYGGDSHVFTKADRAELESVDASFEFKKIDGAGHLVPWDQPERLGEFIAQYIRSFEKQSRQESKDGERF